MTRKPSIAIVGAGSLANSLAPALRRAGYTISEIIGRDSPRSRRSARKLAATVGAQAVTPETAALKANLLWFCVPDRQIRAAAATLAAATNRKTRFAFHSSGALTSLQLDPLRRRGIAVASVHPLMTFVPGSHPAFAGVPFALEGDAAATRIARRIVRDLGGDSFALSTTRKPAYHAWATMTSPLLLAFLVTLEEAARAAGLTTGDSKRRSLPIIRQTLENYLSLGPRHSFSGPIIRGDVETVGKHLSILERHPEARDVYVVLARSALRKLPAKRRNEFQELLRPV
ncbi:MAG TPA: Rossmann-like and DUF2520 domain-containing protein [Terriglobales bacterium]|nr:Rossmann-like and DUF2520 domain-containing protein [Terriglobales bacterium]